MAEKEQNVTLFNNPALTLIEVKMKLRAALRAVGKLFTFPQGGHHTKSSPIPDPEDPIVPNKLKKKTNQHYHLIRTVSPPGGRESFATSEHASLLGTSP
jgi:hypothetical protein